MFGETIASIKPLNASAMARCRIRLDNLTKPLDSLYTFEHLACKMAGITGNPRPGELFPQVFLINWQPTDAGNVGYFRRACFSKNP